MVSRELEPVLTIDPGDSVRFETLGTLAGDVDGESRSSRASPEDDGHALAGPIEVRGAHPGQTLVRAASTRSMPGPWGETLDASGRIAFDWELADGVGRASTGHSGAARAVSRCASACRPSSHGVHSTDRRRAPQGGNIDCKELVAGTTFYLPIPVDGALLLGR